MKYIMWVLIALLMAVLFAVVLQAADKAEVKVKVRMLNEPGHDDEVEVYGSFSAREGEYGGMEIAFYEEAFNISYSLRELSDIGDLAESLAPDGSRIGAGDIALAVNLFLKPHLSENGNIRLTGIKRTINKNDAGNGFLVNEEPLDILVANRGKEVITVDCDLFDDLLQLELTAELREPPKPHGRGDEFTLRAYYSLYNEDDQVYLCRDDTCCLAFTPGARFDNPVCGHQTMVYEDNGDSLLYLVRYNIEDIYRRDGGTVDITLAVDRHYILNPVSFFTLPDEPTGEPEISSPGTREIDRKTTINGKSRKVYAEIDDDRVKRFRLDNIDFLARDIIANWDEIVSILKTIETTGNHKYRKPRLPKLDRIAGQGAARSIFNNPDNFAGDRISSTSFSKTITVYPRDNIEIEIPFGKNTPFSFRAREYISLNQSPTEDAADVMPEIIEQWPPEYPAEIKAAGIGGTVVVKSFIDSSGEVVKVGILESSGSEQLDRAALEAARKSKFKPALKNGQPVATWISHKMVFTLDN